MLRPLAPIDRVAAILDPHSMMPVDDALAAPRASPHLARWRIAARDDDGVVLARGSVHARPVLIAAQDQNFLGGSVGERHGAALAALFECALLQRPAAVILLLASGGVRLHEANAAELALSRALRGLLDTRAASIPVLAIGAGDVFGGASVLACASDRLAMLPGTRLGLSGPKVIEMVHGRAELDADDTDAIDRLFGAEARAAAGQLELLMDDEQKARAWIAVCARSQPTFMDSIMATHGRLETRLCEELESGPHAASASAVTPRLPFFADAQSVDRDGWLWKARGQPIWITRPPGAAAFGPRQAHGIDAALLAHLAGGQADGSQTLIIVEDSPGHEATRRAEAVCVAQYLAQHAAVLALLRARGVRLLGLLAGLGHSAAFFANALQAPALCALETARVMAMDPAAIARVTGLDAAELGALIENDSLLGQPVGCFARWGGVVEILGAVDDATLAELADRAR